MFVLVYVDDIIVASFIEKASKTLLQDLQTGFCTEGPWKCSLFP
jgi:hypothetical protein